MILDGQCGAFNPLLLECLKDIEDIIEVSLDIDAQMDVNPSLVTKVTEELLDSRIVEKASYSSWRLEKEQEKRKFFTAGLEEIQFEYDSAIEAVTLSEYGAKLLRLREVIIKPEQGEETFLGSENIKTLTKALHQTTPVNSEIRMKFLANYPEGQRWCQVIAKSLWSREEEPKYIGVLGRIIDIHEKDTIYFDNNKDVTKGTKAELKEIVEFLKEPKMFTEMGAKIPKGVLLYGKPGTGKTLIAKAIAGEADVPFISMSGSEFIEMFAGLGASRVRKLFEKARKISPCIVFIDEIDAIGSRRTSNSGAETENNQTLNQLLVEMDGFSSEETIIVLAATNRPEMLDKALLRPGRFDRQITIPAPDIAGREEILKIHSKDKKLANDVSLHSIAEDTAGFTGAELANILNEAAIIATKNRHNAITNDDLDEAVKKVTVGLEKTSRKISDKDKKLTAYHEAGHAIVSQFLPTQTAVKEISIVPRGVAGGYTMYKSDEDKSFISKTEMEEKLIALLGGRAAEKIVLDDISTGASNDIEVATEIAKNMVTVYGMSDVVGPICLKSSDGNYEYQLLGNNMEDVIGQEVKKLIDTAYKSAQQILLQNMDLLHAIAAELIAKEKINEEEFNKFFM